jgi:hypothetical protein
MIIYLIYLNFIMNISDDHRQGNTSEMYVDDFIDIS